MSLAQDHTADSRKLVKCLYHWGHVADQTGPVASRARAALAHLRHGLGKSLGDVGDATRHVAPLLPEQSREPWVDEVFYLVATLFACHPVPFGADGSRHRDLGRVFRLMENRTQPNEPVEASERRFVALLNASPERLGGHLRHAVRMAATAAYPVAIDWCLLTDHLLDYADPDARRMVKRIWSKSYWGFESPARPETAAAAEESNA